MLLKKEKSAYQPINNATLFEYIDNNTEMVKMYEFIANDGYKLYDKTEERGVDTETGLMYPPTFSNIIVLPLSVTFENYVAISEDVENVVNPNTEEATTEDLYNALAKLGVE